MTDKAKKTPVLFEDVGVRFHACEPFSVGTEGILHKVSAVYKIMYVYAGSTTMRYRVSEDGGMEEVLLGAGDLIFLPPGTYYSNVNNDRDGIFDGVNLSFLFEPHDGKTSVTAPSGMLAQEYVVPSFPAVADIYASRPIAGKIEFADAPLLNAPFCMNDSFGVKTVLDRLTIEKIRRPPFCLKVCGALVTELLVKLIRNAQSGYSVGDAKTAERVILYIAKQYQEKLTCGSVGRALGYHPNYLNTLFRRVTGMTLHRYITDVKLQRAEMLVRGSDMPISEIAALLSFCDAGAFTKLFAAKYGLTPLKYRFAAK